eukprot:c5737_g1_i1.p1 GENE.c5737_g1_i1~~c5737_g1_i1.p1  ORF type:complete len:183 (-),score=53.41 c5737_g1_i1:197-745(-)
MLIEPTCFARAQLSLYSVKAVLVLNAAGARLVARYYGSDFADEKAQLAFEKSLFSKTHRIALDVLLFEGFTCVYKSFGDVFFYIVGANFENELVLVSVLDCLCESVNTWFKDQYDALAILENLSVVLLLVDEMIDNGIILETSPEILLQRVQLEPQTSKKIAKAATSVMEKGLNGLKRALLT